MYLDCKDRLMTCLTVLACKLSKRRIAQINDVLTTKANKVALHRGNSNKNDQHTRKFAEDWVCRSYSVQSFVSLSFSLSLSLFFLYASVQHVTAYGSLIGACFFPPLIISFENLFWQNTIFSIHFIINNLSILYRICYKNRRHERVGEM